MAHEFLVSIIRVLLKVCNQKKKFTIIIPLHVCKIHQTGFYGIIQDTTVPYKTIRDNNGLLKTIRYHTGSYGTVAGTYRAVSKMKKMGGRKIRKIEGNIL